MKLNQQTSKKVWVFLSSALIIGLSSCSDSQESKVSKAPLKGPTTGILTDAAPVAGVAYTTSSGSSGTTDAQGMYRYNHGDNVKFQLGELIIGDIKATGIVTPIELAAGNENKLQNLPVFLQSLDSDNDLSNGISIPAEATAALKSTLNLASDPVSFANSAILKTARDAAGLAGDIKSAEAASADFLTRGISLLSSHIWVKYDDTNASVIRVAADGSGEFLQGEATADDSCDENRVCGGSTIIKAGVEYGVANASQFDTRGFNLNSSLSVDTNLRAGLSHPRPTWRVHTDGNELIISDIVVAQRAREQSGVLGELFHIARPIELSSDDEPILTEIKEKRYTKMDNNASGIVGAWELDQNSVKTKLLLFFPNNKFMLVDPLGTTFQSEQVECGSPGVEFASYAYNANSKELNIKSFIYDTNGCVGFSNGSDKPISFDISANGNTAVLSKQGEASVTLYRASN
ncbi:adhesin [Nitrosomonas communis]|uniref:Adhesin n=1 Tax=Nitrosomonas communis TaxID=44574 RepID=A0A1H2Y959_9PROT|nr:adhesin [Nitrosomonas communis]SDX01495.1 hypothetical protein SAMN05421882_104813 [Nitrosomonas communis]